MQTMCRLVGNHMQITCSVGVDALVSSLHASCLCSSQADSRDVAKRICKDYDEARRTGQFVHRVTHYIASTNPGCWGSDLRAFASGQSMSEGLRSELTAYQLCVLDDSMAEGPHAYISGCGARAPSSKPAWWSSTIRLGQNLALVDAAMEAHDGALGVLYQKWQVMGQRSMRLYNRLVPKRQSSAQLLSFVYRTGEWNMLDWSFLDVKGPSPTSDTRGVAKSKTSLQAMQHEYIACILQEGRTYTVAMPRPSSRPTSQTNATSSCDVSIVSASQSCSLRVFRIVCLGTSRKKVVRTVSTSLRASFSIPAQIQNLTLWNPHADDADSFDAYTEGYPQHVDLSVIASWSALVSSTKRWSVCDSDVEGCIGLGGGQLLADKEWNCMDSSTPVFIIVRALIAEGWRPGSAPKMHTCTSERLFGVDHFVERKSYLQCLLAWKALVERGLQSLPSGKSQSYYTLVLHSDCPADVSFARASALMQSAPVVYGRGHHALPLDDAAPDSSDDEVVIGQVQCSDPASAAGVVYGSSGATVPAYTTSVGALDSVVHAVAQERLQGASSRASPPVPIAATHKDRPGCSSSDSDAAVIGHLGERGYKPLFRGEDLLFWVEEHGCPGQRNHYTRLGVKCPLASCKHQRKGKPCMKYRNMHEDQQLILGPYEPEAYLRVWASMAGRANSASHHIRKCLPTESQLRVWAAGAELVEASDPATSGQ